MSRFCLSTVGSALTRSMVQPGRFVLPMGDKEFHQTYSIFKHIPLMKKGCVNALPLPPAEELQIIEDCSDTAMPSFTGDTYKPSKGERVFSARERGQQHVSGQLLEGHWRRCSFQATCLVGGPDHSLRRSRQGFLAANFRGERQDTPSVLPWLL